MKLGFGLKRDAQIEEIEVDISDMEEEEEEEQQVEDKEKEFEGSVHVEDLWLGQIYTFIF